MLAIAFWKEILVEIYECLGWIFCEAAFRMGDSKLLKDEFFEDALHGDLLKQDAPLYARISNPLCEWFHTTGTNFYSRAIDLDETIGER